MTQIRLSIELGVCQETVSAYESGKHYPSFEILQRMSELFDAGIDYIMGRSDIRNVSAKPLSVQDENLLQSFRALDSQAKAKVEAYMEELQSK